jgi:hypothetical protein
MGEIRDLEHDHDVIEKYKQNPRLHCVNPRIELTPDAEKREIKKANIRDLKGDLDL